MLSEKTIRTWPSKVESFEDVPSTFKDYIEPLIKEQPSFPYTVFTPASRWGRSKNNAMLTSVIDNTIYFFEKAKKNVITKFYHFNDINYVEIGTILLCSWFRVAGKSNGIPTCSRVDFNTVGDRWFKYLIDLIRLSVNRMEGQSDTSKELDKFNYLSSLNYKFMSYARDSIKKGEKVINILLQPTVFVKLFKIFNKVFYKTASNAHLNILTEKELIIIKDADNRFWKYGGISTFIPLEKINDIVFDSEEKGKLLYLTIKLKENDCIRSIFEVSNKQNLELLIDRFTCMKSKTVSE